MPRRAVGARPVTPEELLDDETTPFSKFFIRNNGQLPDETKNPDTWKIEDGAFVAHGKRGHLFYDGPGLPFKNFELKADVKTTSGSNGGIYIHTQYQPSGWPIHGYEIQVNQTHSDWRKSGSIYSVNDVKEQHVKDDEWYSYHIIVNGKRIIVKDEDAVTAYTIE